MERSEAMAEGLGGQVALLRVDGGTHAVNLTHPDPVNNAIKDFLGLD
jgi:pimeloyl-ACP methyl ester carboxylesterase